MPAKAMTKTCLALLLSARLAWPAAAGPEPESPYALAARLAGSGQAAPRNYLLPLVALRQQQAAYTFRDTTNYERAGYYWQALATYAALADETDSAAYYWQRQPGYGSAPAGAGAPVPVPPPAQTAILAQTRQRQLVLFNEEHTQPRGRWLVGSLLPALYQQGFRYLALEALNTDDSVGVRQRGYPVASSGFYTNEPHFGNLIRQARALGFRVVGYDAMSADRERDEARNLLAVTLKTNPQARVVVLAGHGHISEAGEGAGKHMAQWLHELSGIDPLTIDQTQAGVFGPAAWRQWPAGAYVVSVSAANQHAWGLTADMYVLNKLNLRESGNSFGQRASRPTPLPLPPDSLRTGRPHVVLVYRQEELRAVPNAEPVAVRCLWPGQAAPSLALVPGRYQVELRDAPGRLSWQQPLTVH